MTFLHSCGNIADLADDFIEADLQVIQMTQQENMGIDDPPATGKTVLLVSGGYTEDDGVRERRGRPGTCSEANHVFREIQRRVYREMGTRPPRRPVTRKNTSRRCPRRSWSLRDHLPPAGLSGWESMSSAEHASKVSSNLSVRLREAGAFCVAPPAPDASFSDATSRTRESPRRGPHRQDGQHGIDAVASPRQSREVARPRFAGGQVFVELAWATTPMRPAAHEGRTRTSACAKTDPRAAQARETRRGRHCPSYLQVPSDDRYRSRLLPRCAARLWADSASGLDLRLPPLQGIELTLRSICRGECGDVEPTGGGTGSAACGSVMTGESSDRPDGLQPLPASAWKPEVPRRCEKRTPFGTVSFCPGRSPARGRPKLWTSKTTGTCRPQSIHEGSANLTPADRGHLRRCRQQADVADPGRRGRRRHSRTRGQCGATQDGKLMRSSPGTGVSSWRTGRVPLITGGPIEEKGH